MFFWEFRENMSIVVEILAEAKQLMDESNYSNLRSLISETNDSRRVS